MSLFSGKTTFTAYGASNSAIEEKNYPYSLRQAMLEYFIGNGDDMVRSIMRARNRSFLADVNKMTRFARSEHPDGLPTVTHGMDQNLEFLPVAILMHDKQPFNDLRPERDFDKGLETDTVDPDREKHADATREMLERIGMDADEVVTQFFEQQEEQGLPRNVKPWDLFVHFGLPIDTDTEAGKEYIYRFLAYLHANQDDSINTKYLKFCDTNGKGGVDKQPYHAINIEEGGVDAFNLDFRYSLAWRTPQNELLKANKNGEIEVQLIGVAGVQPRKYSCPVGETMVITSQLRWNAALWHGWLYRLFGNAAKPEYQILRSMWDNIGAVRSDGFHDLFIVCKRMSATEYDVIFTVGLSQAYKVNVKDNPTSDRQFRYADFVPSQHIDDPTLSFGEQFRLPLAIHIMKEMGFTRSERLLAESLTITVILVQKEHRQWYEQKFWGFFFLVVTLILIAYGQVWIAEWLIPIVGEFLANAILVLTISVTFSLASASLPSEMMLFFAVAFAIVSIAQMAQSASGGQFKFNWQTIKSMGWATAVDMLNTVMGVLQSMQQYILEGQMKEFQEEMNLEYASLKEKQEELERLWDELGSSPIDAISLVKRSYITRPLETPSEYYNRTLSKNPGVLALEMPSKFHALARRLPQTAGEPTIVDNLFDRLYEMRLSNG